MATYCERLKKGLVALGFRPVPSNSKKYAAFLREDKERILYVGRAGALRSGRSASESFSLGDPSNQTATYKRVLAAADSTNTI